MHQDMVVLIFLQRFVNKLHSLIELPEDVKLYTVLERHGFVALEGDFLVFIEIPQELIACTFSRCHIQNVGDTIPHRSDHGILIAN